MSAQALFSRSVGLALQQKSSTQPNMSFAVFLRAPLVAAVAFVAVSLQGCGNAVTPATTTTTTSPATTSIAPATKNVVQIAQGNPDLSDLVAAIVKANLSDPLSQSGPFTVFAPSNAAFAALCTTLNKTLAEVLELPTLSAILQYHVVPGKIMSGDLKAAQAVVSLQGSEVVVKVADGTVTVNGAKVIKADVLATNGVIHIIDAVLLPPAGNVVQIAQGNPDLSNLVAAIVKAKLDAPLSQSGPFTVFAPTNAAFAALCKTLNKTIAEVLELPTLSAILQYHVVPGNIFSFDLKASQQVKTLQGSEVVVKAADGTVTVNNATVIKADVIATNGVVHIINAVLLNASAHNIGQTFTNGIPADKRAIVV